MTHTVEARACYCRACKKVSRHYGVAFGGEIVAISAPICDECGSDADTEPVRTCAGCGREVREGVALYNSDEECYYCTDCRTACSVCGEAHEEYLLAIDEDGNAWCDTCEYVERNKRSVRYA